MVREQSHELTHYAIGASLIWREREREGENPIYAKESFGVFLLSLHEFVQTWIIL